MLGRWNGYGIELEELHRFPNGPVEIEGHLHWDVERLWSEIKQGIALYAARYNEPLISIGVDSWAVDYALLDAEGQLLGLPFHYRDHRTDALMDAVIAKVGKTQLFERSGLQFLPFNTLYQLYSQSLAADPALQKAATMLMIPDLFHYRLSGRKVAEYTNATTTQFFSVRQKGWDTELLRQLGIPFHFLPEIVAPGSVLGELQPELAEELGLRNQSSPVLIVAPGTHDTASAVAGTPYLDQNRAFISNGTWSLVGMEVAGPVLGTTALDLNFTNEGGVAGTIRLLKNVMGLWLVQECQRIWREQGQNYSWNDLVQQARQAEAFVSLIDPDAPDFLNPTSMPQAIQAYCQRSGQPTPETPGAVIRCCLESLALKYRLVVEQLELLLDHTLSTIRIVGGGSQNEVLCQFTADACGREVIAGPVEATALGNVLVQAIATGQLSDLDTGREALKTSISMKRYVAEQDKEKEWAEVFRRFKRLVNGQE
jgi:rhamnulokinase